MIFDLPPPKESGGQGLCVTESMRLLEAVSSSSPWLGEHLAAVNTYGLSAVERCGSPAQKEKYLPR